MDKGGGMMEKIIFYMVAIPLALFIISAIVTIGEKIIEFLED